MPALLYLIYFPIVSFFVTSSLLILFFAIFLYILSFPLIPLSAAGPTEVKRKSPLTTAWAWALLQVFSTGYTTNICVSSTSSSCWSLTWLAIFAKAFLTAMCKGWDYNNSYGVLHPRCSMRYTKQKYNRRQQGSILSTSMNYFGLQYVQQKVTFNSWHIH